RVCARATWEELRDTVGRLGRSPWDVPAPTGNRGNTGVPAGPGRLSSWALHAPAALLLPAEERARWTQEWKGELRALESRRARARFISSLLLAGGRHLAVTLRL